MLQMATLLQSKLKSFTSSDMPGSPRLVAENMFGKIPSLCLCIGQVSIERGSLESTYICLSAVLGVPVWEQQRSYVNILAGHGTSSVKSQ